MNDCSFPLGLLMRSPDVTLEKILFLKSNRIGHIQLAGVTSEQPHADYDRIFHLTEQHAIKIDALFLSFSGQDWNRAAETVGLIPPATRAARMSAAMRQMDYAATHGISCISCHIGHLPEKADAFYRDFLAQFRTLVNAAAKNQQDFLIETGPDRVMLLKRLFADLNCRNAGLNFDPANLLIYNCDSPALLLDELFDRIKIVHCKDAVRPSGGDRLGHETVLGKGDTDFPALLNTLKLRGFSGKLVIEREIPPGPEQEQDIAIAADWIRNLMKG